MLEKMVPQLLKDLGLEENALRFSAPGALQLPLGEGIGVAIKETPEGFVLKASLAVYPKEKEEAVFMHALHGNLFGLGTDNAALGLTEDGKTFTLTRVIDHPVIEYKQFREILDDFINAIDFWREEILNQK
jgi:hypothetical protein